LAKPVYLFSFLFLLFACEEDLNTLGFKSEQNKVKVYYAEIPLESSVVLMDSLRTTNFTGETNRTLAGSYADPVFGPTQALSIMQFRPTNNQIALPATAIFDSIVFQMRFDFYTYGALGKTTQTYDIYELTQELNPGDDYFFNSEVGISNSSLGSKSVEVNYDFFKQEFEDTDEDSVFTLKIKLNKDFGQRLFDAVDPEDVNYTNFDLFKANFKGIAIAPQLSDKIVGFNPFDLNSSIVLHYHDGTDAKTLFFDFNQSVSFSKIISDRSSSELSGLNQYFTDFEPGFKRYVQGGTSIITKLDLTKFYDYMDTLKNVIVNSAELEFSGVETSSTFKVPASMSMAMLESNYRYKTLKDAQDTLDYIAFGGTLTLGDQSKFFVSQEGGRTFSINHSTTTNNYSGLATLFIQKLFDLKSKRYPFWAIRPLNPQPGKSVDRAVFPKENITLKIYYTRATLENQ
jgi:hypothetical protein